jgi:hypothetical protein
MHCGSGQSPDNRALPQASGLLIHDDDAERRDRKLPVDIDDWSLITGAAFIGDWIHVIATRGSGHAPQSVTRREYGVDRPGWRAQID